MSKLAKTFSLAIALPALSAPAFAADVALKLDLPQLDVAEYHKPYVAVWIERPDQSFVGNLSVLYDVKKKDNGGAKYLKDLRQWWRKSGRDVQTPIDGVTGATRAPGSVALAYAGTKSPLQNLPAGKYEVVVEAAREGGGHETVRLPLDWPAKAAQSVTGKGKEELGNLSLQVTP
jgi:hypothetical protein